jgi:hypothetical protein
VKLSSEAGVSALLSATAGVLISQSHLFVAATPTGALKGAFYILIYVAVFASAPISMVAMRRMVTLGADYKPFAASMLGGLACYFILAQNLISFSANDNSFQMLFFDKPAGPLLILPIIWFGIHLFDYVTESIA